MRYPTSSAHHKMAAANVAKLSSIEQCPSSFFTLPFTKLNLAHTVCTALCALFFTTGYAQPLAENNLFKDDSVVKRVYYEQALKDHRAIIGGLPKENKEAYKKIYESRFLLVTDLFKTARSVTTADANNYLQQIVGKITSANPELQLLKMRVVFTRDWWPNAYSIGEGTIAINAGLLGYLNSEAELVFALCHEMAHYYLDHSGSSIKKYVETVNDGDFQKELKRLSKQQYRVNEQLETLAKSIVFDSRKHSRTNEAASDIQAYRFMKNSGYDCNSMISTLQLLDKIDDSSLFKPLVVEQVFNFPEYPFKQKWTQKETSIFSEVNDVSELTQKEKDSLKTHPECVKRISLLKDSVAFTGKQGHLFLVSEQMFTQVKNELLVEIAEYCFTEQNLSRNLYYSLALLQSGQEATMARYSVVRCLNKIYEKQRDHLLGLCIERESSDYPDDYNALLRMLGRLRLEDLAAINTNFCRQFRPEMKNHAGFTTEMVKALDHN